MRCSLDIRERVVAFVSSGGSKAEAARRYNVSRRTVHYWLRRENLSPTPATQRHRKIDKVALRRYVEANPQALLREISEHFGVAMSSISRCLAKMKIVKKTKSAIWSEVI